VTYNDWQITQSDVMLQSNPNKLGLHYTEGLENQFSVEIHRIPIALLCSSELELEGSLESEIFQQSFHA
jgi:hypothetical protein